jgi:hemin uptake protein HemP
MHLRPRVLSFSVRFPQRSQRLMSREIIGNREKPHPLYEQATPREPPVITTEELFRGQDVVAIERNGETYRLIMTKAGKLILNK